MMQVMLSPLSKAMWPIVASALLPGLAARPALGEGRHVAVELLSMLCQVLYETLPTQVPRIVWKAHLNSSRGMWPRPGTRASRLLI